MTPRFNAATRSYRAARQVRFIIRWSIAGVIAVATAMWIGARL